MSIEKIKYGTPSIYVACLAAYNNGFLHGAWIDATQEVDDIQEQISNMLKNSPIPNAEEYGIFDYEHLGASASKHEDIEIIHEIALFVSEHGELGEAILDYACDLDHAKNLMEENYHGEYDSEEDYARQLYEDCMEIPDHLANYIDYDAVARDLFCDGYFSIEINHKVHVFSEY